MLVMMTTMTVMIVLVVLEVMLLLLLLLMMTMTMTMKMLTVILFMTNLVAVVTVIKLKASKTKVNKVKLARPQNIIILMHPNQIRRLMKLTVVLIQSHKMPLKLIHNCKVNKKLIMTTIAKRKRTLRCQEGLKKSKNKTKTQTKVKKVMQVICKE